MMPLLTRFRSGIQMKPAQMVKGKSVFIRYVYVEAQPLFHKTSSHRSKYMLRSLGIIEIFKFIYLVTV